MKGGLPVQYGTRRPWAPSAPSLRRWAGAALADGPRGAGLGIRVVGTAEGRRLNRVYRGKDRPTNVLSFAADAGAGPGGIPRGHRDLRPRGGPRGARAGRQLYAPRPMVSGLHLE